MFSLFENFEKRYLAHFSQALNLEQLIRAQICRNQFKFSKKKSKKYIVTKKKSRDSSNFGFERSVRVVSTLFTPPRAFTDYSKLRLFVIIGKNYPKNFNPLVHNLPSLNVDTNRRRFFSSLFGKNF